MEPEVMDRPSGVDAGDLSHRIIDILNDGALALLLSIGHRTKLFDVMVGRPPSTAEEIAEAASLNEAMDKFPEAIAAAVERMIEEAREAQREEASRIIVPGQPPPGGRIKL